MADDPGVLESLYLLGRAIGNLCSRRRRKKPDTRPLHDRVQGAARITKQRPPERRTQLEDFRRHLTEHFGADRTQQDNEKVVKEENERIGARLITDGFLPLLHDEEVLAGIRRKQEAQQSVDTSKARIKELREEELQILVDVVDNIDDNTVTPMFNEKLREFFAALQAQESAKQELENSKEQAEIHQARLERTERLARRGFGRWIFDPQPVQEALNHSRLLVQFLESTASCYAYIVEQRLDNLWELRASKDWAVGRKPQEALLAAEQWDEAIRRLQIHRKNIDNARNGYRTRLQEGLEAGRTQSEIDREHAQLVRDQTRGVFWAENEVRRTRRQALAHGAEMLEVPETWGDDPISEPASTLASDGRVGSMAAEELEKHIQSTDFPQIEVWNHDKDETGSRILRLYRERAASEPSEYLQSDAETTDLDSNASEPLSQGSVNLVRMIERRLGPGDSHSVRESRRNVRRKIRIHAHNRNVSAMIRHKELPEDYPLEGMRYKND